MLSVLFGGQRSTRSVVTGLGRAVGGMAGRRGVTSRTAQRREAADEQATRASDDLQDPNDRVADRLAEIDGRWQQAPRRSRRSPSGWSATTSTSPRSRSCGSAATSDAVVGRPGHRRASSPTVRPGRSPIRLIASRTPGMNERRSTESCRIVRV